MNIWPPLTRRGRLSDKPIPVLGSLWTPCSTLTSAKPKPKLEGWIKGVVFDGFGGVHNTPLVIFDYIQPLPHPSSSHQHNFCCAERENYEYTK